MSNPSPSAHAARLKRRAIVGVLCGSALGLLSVYSLDKSGALDEASRWAWFAYPAAGAALFGLIVAVVSSRNIRGLLKAVFLGMLLCMTAAGALSVFLANWGDVTGAKQLVGVTPLAAFIVGLPAAMVLGALVGLLLGLLKEFRRRRFQFGVRGLLLLMTVVGLLLSLGLWLAGPTNNHLQRRQAIARILASGGSIHYVGQRRAWPEWYETLLGGDFEQGRYGAVASVGLGPSATDDDLACMKWFPELNGLSIFGSRITDGGLAHLSELHQLDHLSLRGARLSGSGLAYVAHLKRLRTLDLDLTANNVSLSHVGQMSNVETLILKGNAATDQGLSELTDMPRLRVLSVYSTTITDAGLVHLTSLPQLETLRLECPRVTDAGLVHLIKVPNLHALSVGAARITDAGMPHLAKMRQLQRLELNVVAVSDAGLVSLAEAPSLRTLSLRSLPITDAGLGHLAQMSQLRHVDLGGTAITDAGLAHLDRLPALRSLDLERTQVSWEAMERLMQKQIRVRF